MDNEVKVPSFNGPPSSRGLPPHDYVSPNLDVIIPDAAFPNMRVGDTRIPQWTWLRKWVSHNWYIDKSLPYAGFASRDEVAIIYNTALKFRGRPCLEVGCWRGWSTVHFALGAGDLHVIDPIVDDPAFAASIRDSCEAAGVLNKITFHAGYSPGAIDALTQELGVKWSLMFIDAEHEGDAPRLDAEAALRNAAEDAIVLFHDLTSPFVAAALHRMRDAGWRTMIYQTMQIMGVAWRGAVEPVQHIPDPNVFWTLPRHLAGYAVSGWEPPKPPHDGLAWWPGMTMEDRRNTAMLLAQDREDKLVEEILGHAKTRTELQTALTQFSLAHQELTEQRQALERLSLAQSSSEAAHRAIHTQYRFVLNQLIEARILASELTGQQKSAQTEHSRVKHALLLEARQLGGRAERLEAELARVAALAEQAQQVAAVGQARFLRFASQRAVTAELAVQAATLRAVFGLLRRGRDQRRTVLRHWADQLGLGVAGTQDLVAHFSRPRVILGLLRRSYRVREALLRLELIKAASLDLDPQAEEQSAVLSIADALAAPASSLDAPAERRPFLISLPMAWRLLSLDLGDEALGALSPYFRGIETEDERVLAWVKAVGLGPSEDDNQGLLHESLAAIRGSAYWDPDFYSQLAGLADEDIDPAVHYLLRGEAIGLPPSEHFDPSYYGQQNFDVLASGMSLLCHYTYHGHLEGRAAHAPKVIHDGALKWDGSKDSILIVSHEASRTGAPVLAWNIAKSLAKRYNVVTVLLGGGALVPDFYAVSTQVCGPFPLRQRSLGDMRFGLADLFASQTFKYALVNSTESRVAIEDFTNRLIPILFLVHEFGTYVYPRAELTQAFDLADELIFPAPIVAQSSLSIYPPLADHSIRLLPQGMSELPAAALEGTEKRKGADKLDVLRKRKKDGAFIVLGAGTVSVRKGVDLFISVAASVRQQPDAPSMHFVWIGQGYRPAEDMNYSVYLLEQIERSGLGDHVTFLEETPDLDQVYALADAFLLTSRLDPLPNVSIDSAWRGIPVVCFEHASGMADLLAQDTLTAPTVVPHLDIEAARSVLLRLAGSETAYAQIAKATAEFARRTFDMERYVEALDAIGVEHAGAARALRRAAEIIVSQKGFSADFFSGAKPRIESREEAVRRYLAAWHRRERGSAWLRRPAPGFNAFAWEASAEAANGETGEAYADFLSAGRPPGVWQMPVLKHLDLRGRQRQSGHGATMAVFHVHTDDMASFRLLAARLAPLSALDVTLIVSAPEGLRATLRQIFDETGIAGMLIDRELPDALALANYLEENADLFGDGLVAHLRATADQVIPSWRDFHWEHLVGGRLAAIEQIIETFHEMHDLGLVFPAEPYYSAGEDGQPAGLVPGGDGEISQDYPEGGMFWARREVLRRLVQINASRADRSVQVSRDVERILPSACRSAGLRAAVVTSLGTDW